MTAWQARGLPSPLTVRCAAAARAVCRLELLVAGLDAAVDHVDGHSLAGPRALVCSARGVAAGRWGREWAKEGRWKASILLACASLPVPSLVDRSFRHPPSCNVKCHSTGANTRHLPAHLCHRCRRHPGAAPAGQVGPDSTAARSRSAAAQMSDGMLQCGQTVRRQMGRSGGNQMQADQSGVCNTFSTCTTPASPKRAAPPFSCPAGPAACPGLCQTC